MTEDLAYAHRTENLEKTTHDQAMREGEITSTTAATDKKL